LAVCAPFMAIRFPGSRGPAAAVEIDYIACLHRARISECGLSAGRGLAQRTRPSRRGGSMYLRRSFNAPVWLFATAILAALSVNSIFLAGMAAACARETVSAAYSASAGANCENPPAASPGGWHTYTQASSLQRIQWRSQKARSEAKRFAERIKRRLERRFAKRKQQFRKHQAAMEGQRRAFKRNKVRNRARQFAAARRRAAQHMPKRRRALSARLKQLGGKSRQYERQGALSSRHGENGRHWHLHWRHRAQTDVK
jgi:hypothetical protein